jgi:hypothetical protein
MSPQLNTSNEIRKSQKKRIAFQQPEAYDFVISAMDTHNNDGIAIPKKVTLLRPFPGKTSLDQLFIDQLPMPREAWRFDDHDLVLSWDGAFGGGHLHIHHDGRGCTGNIGPVYDHCSVKGAATASYLCDVALDTGATYVSSGNKILGMKWDAESDKWKSASWVNKRLLLSYTVSGGGPVDPPSMTFGYEDLQTDALPWDPAQGTYASLLTLGLYNGSMVWELEFKSQMEPDADNGTSTGPDSVYPYWLQAREDASADNINGVLVIDDFAPNGKLVGFQGVLASKLTTGYYQANTASAPFAIFDGRLFIDNKAIPGAYIAGNTLHYSGLSDDYQQRTGLPESSVISLASDGSIGYNADDSIKILKLSGNAAIAAITQHRELHQQLFLQSDALQKALAATPLPVSGLLSMSPFGMDDGKWRDVIQAAVTDDLSQIMNSFIPETIWTLVFPNQAHPTITGYLAEVATTAVPGQQPPADFYASLATAVLTQGMANGSDEYCKNMNGPRAAEWLRTQVASSKIYYEHSQLLFKYEWAKRFPNIKDYLQDQQRDPSDTDATYKYADIINNQVRLAIDDITKNVEQENDSDLKAQLIKEVTEQGQFAIDAGLYYAFIYYKYNTSAGLLANIQNQINFNTGSTDGTTITRLFQQNIAVLTALDQSGHFAREYNKTINIFMGTNILPNMVGFDEDDSSFDMIKEYMERFVNENVNNEDKQIAEAASQIKQILEEEGADQLLHDSIVALRAFSDVVTDALALPYVAKKYVDWFSKTYSKSYAVSSVFGSVLIGGISALSIFNMITEFKQWKDLSDAERAQLIIEAIQMGIQVLSAIVKRGIRIYSIFNVEGMTFWQRTGAINRILIAGEAEKLDAGLMKIGNTTARWLADTEGTVGKFGGVVTETSALTNAAVTGAEEASLAAKIFGKNLDEFIATRIGPLFILAGMGFSLYSMIEGESGVQLASDILNFISGGLMLFATIGEWAIAGVSEAAAAILTPIVAVAGALAIVLALAGLGLMLYELFKKQPDPVEKFVNDYVKPAGFYVSSQADSMDYAVCYNDKDQNNLLIIGFSCSVHPTLLPTLSKTLQANNDGNITLVEMEGVKKLPAVIWQAKTDALGLTKIFTFIQPDSKKPAVVALLSAMSDNTVAFKPLMPWPVKPQPDEVKVLTQTWYGSSVGNAKVNSEGLLKSMSSMFRPVYPDKDGTYTPPSPDQKTFLTVTAAGNVVVSDKDADVMRIFDINMSGMAPNYMSMRSIKFLLNTTPSTDLVFSPSFAVMPSTAIKFKLNKSLPDFLKFNEDIGTLVPNGGIAGTQSDIEYNITATNLLGSDNAYFNISVAPLPVVTANQLQQV